MRVGDDELEPPRRAGPDVVEDQLSEQFGNPKTVIAETSANRVIFVLLNIDIQ